MPGMHKSRQNSEVKRKELLAKLALIRTEAEKIGAQVQLLENINKVEQDIKSARVNIKAYRDFLMEENNKLETIKKSLDAIKEAKHKNVMNQTIFLISMLLVTFIPNLFLDKRYYLSLIPKHIPVSSTLIYIGIGDILFYTWIYIYIFYAIAYVYISKNYMQPFIENNPSLKIPIKFFSASMFIFFYSQFLFYSASSIPTLISPTWGPSVENVLNLIITFLTSSPINAVIGLITIWPIIGMIMKKYKKYWSFHSHKFF